MTSPTDPSIYHEIAWYQRFDVNTPIGKQYAKACESDCFHNTKPEPSFDSTDLVHNAMSRLQQPHLGSAVEAYEQAKKKRSGIVSWYSLYGGPTSIKQLADQVGYGSQYELLYRSHSEFVHGTNAMDGLQIRSGKGVYRHIRRPDNLGTITTFTATCLLGATFAVIKHYCPDRQHQYADWWKSSGSAKLRKFANLTVKINDPEDAVPK